MNIHLTGVSSLVEGKQRFKSFPSASASSEKVRFPPLLLPLPHHCLGEMRSFRQRLLYVRHKLDRQGPGGETHSVWLLAGKPTVTPLKGTIMWWIELSGLLVLSCLLCSLCICLPPTVEVKGRLQAPNG